MYHPGEDEEWRAIPGYPEYSVSTLGRVWSNKAYRLLKLTFDGNYMSVSLYNSTSTKAKKASVHRLVAASFIPNPLNLPEVNHDDGDKTHNYINNLEWVTYSENALHAFRMGLRKPCNPGKRIKIIETGQEYRTISECAIAIGGNHSNILSCLEGRRNRHKGFSFELVTT